MWNKRLHTGITLLEVLIAIFIVGIGLLGVLAVIPFGAFQVSKANHARYASNMLANAAEEVVIRGMVRETSGDRFVWVEPHKVIPPLHPHVHIDFQNGDPTWKEIMRGQDDLVYTTHGDRRPDFSGQGGKIQSSGRYTWLFTYMPPQDGSDSIVVDVLACHNRIPEDDEQIGVPKEDISDSMGGATITFNNARHLIEPLSQTKYVFVTWEGTLPNRPNGAWCRIVFLERSDNPRIVVTGNLPSSDAGGDSMQVYIANGVLYHKQVRIDTD